ncbi:MAG: protein kinase [Alphaproteobacteria bacterium]|nr:protein kinase [Alphaproteobacteria bacterium]
MQLAEALAHAHARGIAHRDLKPENVLVSAGGQATLIDLGVGWAADAGEGLSGEGQGPGTPRYMPPERLVGRPEDPRPGDVYALGVVLWERLSARLAFAELAPADLLAAKRAGPLPALSGEAGGARGAAAAHERARGGGAPQRRGGVPGPVRAPARGDRGAWEHALDADGGGPGAGGPRGAEGSWTASPCCRSWGAAAWGDGLPGLGPAAPAGGRAQDGLVLEPARPAPAARGARAQPPHAPRHRAHPRRGGGGRGALLHDGAGGGPHAEGPHRGRAGRSRLGARRPGSSLWPRGCSTPTSRASSTGT